MSKRREFLKQALSIPVIAASSCNSSNLYVGKESTPALAINMWDFTWLLRSHTNGGFENWAKALDDLVLRGYNAIRMDCFPQFIARDKNGFVSDEYKIPTNQGRALWGNKSALTINPKESLIKFINLCNERDIKLVLSSWFASHGTGRNNEFNGADGLVNAWDETLHFLKENDLLSNVYYVDLLNEYPLWHGYGWLNRELEKLASPTTKSSKGWDFLNKKNAKYFNPDQINFYNSFVNEVLQKLKRKWPQLLFTVSQTNTLNVPWQDLDVSECEVLDIHLWLVYNKKFSKQTGYFDNIHTLTNKKLLSNSFSSINDYWVHNQGELSDWLEEQIILRSKVAINLGIPLGNTEGWGAVMWEEGSGFSWDFIKEAGLLGAKLGKKYNYAFNCSSNFNHPHFESLWNDIAWHKEVTSIIKS